MKFDLSRLIVLGTVLAAGTAAAAEITFFERPGFRGRSISAEQTIPNFADIGFNAYPYNTNPNWPAR